MKHFDNKHGQIKWFEKKSISVSKSTKSLERDIARLMKFARIFYVVQSCCSIEIIQLLLKKSVEQK